MAAVHKPFRPAVDYEHPLAGGLVAAYLFNDGNRESRDVQGRYPAVLEAAAGFTVLPKDGRCFKAGGGTTGAARVEVAQGSPLDLTGVFSIATKVTFAADYADEGLIEKTIAEHVNTQWLLFREHGKIYWRRLDTSYVLANCTIEGPTVNDFQTYSFVAMVHPGYYDNLRLYVDGVDYVSAQIPNGQAATGTGGLFFGRLGDTVYRSTSTIHYAYFYNRQLTASEVSWLHREPYSFLAPQSAVVKTRLLSVPAAAPAGAAISGSSAGVATASGAITADGALVGSSAGAATTTGTLAAPGDIVGSSAGAATTSGALTGSAAAAGSSAGAATTAGAVTGAGSLAGSSAGAATPTGTLAGAGAMEAAAAGTATVSGACDGFSACEGAAAGTATTSGAIAGTAAAVGTSAGVATGSATLLGAGALAGVAAGVATVFGVFEGTVVDIASGPVLTCAIPADAELACRIPDDPTLNLRC